MTRSEPRPTDLLRLRDAVEPYPAEPSDEQLAEELGLPPEQVVRFDMNTLGGGPLPAVVEAMRSFDPGRMVEYGDQAYRRLRAAIHDVTGAPEHRVIPGAGADELIRLVSSMTVGPGDSVVIPTPTFAMFAVEARLAGAGVVEVARDDPGERQPIERIRESAERAGARLVWLCSPNNPTGDGYTADEIAVLADGLPALVVVDTVYQEMAEVSLGMSAEGASLRPCRTDSPTSSSCARWPRRTGWPAREWATWSCPMGSPPASRRHGCHWRSAAPARRPPSRPCPMRRPRALA